jgi:hypothetical protein
VRVKGIPNTLWSAAAFGAAWGLGESLGALAHSRVLVDQPIVLIAWAVCLTAVVAVPAGLLARPQGWVGALVGLLGLELLLLVLTDPPPFQEPAWYVGSPIAAVLGVGALVLTRHLLVRTPGRVGVVLGVLAVMWGLRPPADALPIRGDAMDAATNVLVVTLDTTRADHCSLYGYERETTPTLDSLGERGLVFDAMWSPIPVTGPAHTTLWSGVGPWEHGAMLNGTPVPEGPWLPERMRSRGYATSAFVSAYVLDGRYGFDRGFEVYDDDFNGLAGTSDLLLGRLWGGVQRFLDPDLLSERRGDQTVSRAMDWWARQEGPRMMWVHLFDAHGPYVAPAGPDFFTGQPDSSLESVGALPVYLDGTLDGLTDTRQVVAEYDREVHFADSQLARLLETVGPDTLVVVVGDHGESFGEGGVWFDHGADLLDHSLRVPMVLAGPGIEAGRRTELTELGELPALIEGALGPGLPQPAETPFARAVAFDREANQALRASDPSARPSLRMGAIRMPGSLVIARGDGSSVTLSGPVSGELSPSEGGDVDAVLKLLSGEVGPRELSDEEAEMLRSLGYLDGLP